MRWKKKIVNSENTNHQYKEIGKEIQLLPFQFQKKRNEIELLHKQKMHFACHKIKRGKKICFESIERKQKMKSKRKIITVYVASVTLGFKQNDPVKKEKQKNSKKMLIEFFVFIFAISIKKKQKERNWHKQKIEF